MFIKTVKVTNNKNVLVQIPGFIVKQWGLKKGCFIDVFTEDDGASIVLRPRPNTVPARSNPNK